MYFTMHFCVFIIYYTAQVAYCAFLSRLKNPYLYNLSTEVDVLPQDYVIDELGQPSAAIKSNWHQDDEEESSEKLMEADSLGYDKTEESLWTPFKLNYRQTTTKVSNRVIQASVDMDTWPTVPWTFLRSRSTTELLTLMPPTQPNSASTRSWRPYFPTKANFKITTDVNLRREFNTLLTTNIRKLDSQLINLPAIKKFSTQSPGTFLRVIFNDKEKYMDGIIRATLGSTRLPDGHIAWVAKVAPTLTFVRQSTVKTRFRIGKIRNRNRKLNRIKTVTPLFMPALKLFPALKIQLDPDKPQDETLTSPKPDPNQKSEYWLNENQIYVTNTEPFRHALVDLSENGSTVQSLPNHSTTMIILLLPGPPNIPPNPLPHYSSTLANPLPDNSTSLAKPLPDDSSRLANPLPDYSSSLAKPLPDYSPTWAIPLPHYSSTLAKPLPDYSPTLAIPLPDYLSSWAKPLPDYSSTSAKPLPDYSPSLAKPLPDYSPTLAIPLPDYSPSLAKPLPDYSSSLAKPLPDYSPSLANALPEFLPTLAKPLPDYSPTLLKPLPDYLPSLVKPSPHYSPILVKPVPVYPPTGEDYDTTPEDPLVSVEVFYRTPTTKTVTTSIKTTTTKKTSIKLQSMKCYECGLNEVGLTESNECADTFDIEDMRGHYLRKRMERRCPPDPYVRGCFVRYLDWKIQYTERGCRSWPPVQGKSYASRRLRKLEYVLGKVENGCIKSPSASLTPFSKSVSLYAFYYACVCNTRKFCNSATLKCVSQKLFGTLCVLFVFYQKYVNILR